MNSTQQHIAVVSMAGIFPGAPDTGRFIRNILEGKSTVVRVPPGRWPAPVEKMVSKNAAPDRAVSDRAGLITDFSFDPHGFGLPPDLLAGLDPVHQLVLQAGRTAIQSCRIAPDQKRRTGVILAAIALPTDAASEISREILLGNARPGLTRRDALRASVVATPAALLANAFGFEGGSYTLDAACASSLFSIKLACDQLALKKADVIVAGGVSRPDSLYTQVGFTQLSALSPSGRCAPFDRGADGLVVGEGCGLLVLKRLEDAMACGDDIHAVIRGFGLSNDIEGNLVGPASEGQVRAMAAAYDMAGWTPAQIQYMECHGSGTPVGDKVETQSIRRLLDQYQCGNASLGIGSVKSNIGHLLTAAGAAGFIKTVMAMNQGVLPPSLNFTGLPDQSPLDGSNIQVQARAGEWLPESPGSPRRAGISAFGFGGINAHVLVEAYRPDTRVHAVGKPAMPDKDLGKALGPIAVVGMNTVTRDCPDLHVFSQLITGETRPEPAMSGARWQRTDFLSEQETSQPASFMESLSVGVGEFHIPPNQMADILPQHLVLLKAAKGALHDAGIPPRPAPGESGRTRMGSAVGIEFDFGAADFYLRWTSPQPEGELLDRLCPPLTFNRTLGALGGIVASRTAREFQLGGPCFTLSSGRASGMRGVEIAMHALAANETDLFLCACVDMAGDIRQFLLNRALEPAEEARPSEGAAALVLKRLDDALRDRDRIYTVITDVFAGPSPENDLQDAARMIAGDTRAASGMFSIIHAALTGQANAVAPGADGIPIHCRMALPPGQSGPPAPRPQDSSKPKSGHKQIRINICRPPIPAALMDAVHDSIPQPGPAAILDPGLLADGTAATARAHEKFLDFTQTNMAEMETQFAALARAAAAEPESLEALPMPLEALPEPLFNRDQCMEFAVGRAGNVLGPQFDIIDTYPVRVRLPDAPLMLVDRIMSIEGEACSLGPGKIVTQHDVRPDAWYLDGGLAPVSVSIEAGQADLFLCAYLGIDHAVQGRRKYRLLDAKVTFHRSLPRPGETIEYHIEIDRFLKQGEVYLFFFHYKGYIGNELLISMRDGCAGFFTEEEVANSGGIILKKEDTMRVAVQTDFRPLVPVEPASFSDDQVRALRQGDMEAAFGPAFRGITLGRAQLLPGGQMHLIDRVLSFDPNGGRFGLGSITAEADIRPDHWFLTCHFIDDMVMPGTLMYECCAHALRIFVQRLGWVSPNEAVHYNVLPANESDLKCRGPVTPDTQKARYEIEIKEMGYTPEPYVIADAHMFSDDHRIVLYKDMGMKLEGLTQGDLTQFWR